VADVDEDKLHRMGSNHACAATSARPLGSHERGCAGEQDDHAKLATLLRAVPP
jgi:hypothetical protein